ncbi:MAG: hypothetical protein NXI04_22520 [Planctomycetaceae bacterium]|nr:hypothetical protein [Planctomycetaceae bacterium]
MGKKKAGAKTRAAASTRKREQTAENAATSPSSGENLQRVWHLREIEDLILQLRADKHTPDAIVEYLRQRGICEYENSSGNQTPIEARTVSSITNQALRSGRLRYFPAEEEELERRISSFNPSIRLENVHVVQTALGKSIARKGAIELLRIMRQHKGRSGEQADRIRVGFFGGRTPSDMMQFLAEEFASLRSSREMKCYPRHITFVSLVGSFPTSRIDVDPNAYFTLFLKCLPEEHGYFEFRFVSLPATGLLTPAEYQAISEFHVVSEAMEQRRELDVIVGSCGHWGPGHHSTYDYVQSACGQRLETLWEETVEQLQEQKIIGDFCWAPVNADGPIPRESLPLRMFTALDFEQIAAFVHPVKRSEHAPGKLLLLVAPCYGSECKKTTKGEVLESILHAQSAPPVTHLVTDSASAREYCQRFHESNRPGPG